MHPLIAALAALITPDARAFCGTYVGQVGAELYNNASQVAIARQGTRTTLTLANDFQGDAVDFALLVPVPEVLGPDDVRTVDTSLVGRLDGYSAPRLVSYTCDDFRDYDDTAESDGDTGAPSTGDPADGVTVEASFTTGAYEIVILSAEESGALLLWLNTNGYAVSEDAGELLQEYLDAGSYFFAAKIALTKQPEGTTWLEPLQFSYDSGVFSLPIRLGTVNASGDQDLILYILGEEGQVHISNYPEVSLEDECMVDLSAWDSLAAFYEAQFAAAMAGSSRPGWLLEYSWAPSSCDPCSGDPLTEEELQTMGWAGDTSGVTFTRLHMRYSPEDVDQDLVLYSSGLSTVTQVRYITYAEDLEESFPICGEGWASDPGSCDGEDPDDGEDDPADSDDEAIKGEEPRRSCGLGAGVGLGPVLGALALISRRRRGAAPSRSS